MNYSHRKAIIPITTVLFVSFLGTTSVGYGQQTDKKSIDIQATFTPSGWMGDGENGERYVKSSEADTTNPHSMPNSIKITYTFGPIKWAGIYWQNKSDNWGQEPGENYSNKGLSKVTFWARGETGREVVEFKSGGIKKREYRDSFEKTLGRVTLSRDWKQYQIDLSEADLSSVIGGFCWVANKNSNSDNNTITFYLDDIRFE